jgi:DNA repair photolyase
MIYRDVTCTQCLKTITRPDALFHGQYTVDPYQNCALGCRYCDSAVETVDVKVNVAEVLAKELAQVPKGRVILGSVHDPYQPVEEERGLSRKILTLLRDQGFSCHILTKSPLVLRDLPIISSFDCRVTVSILSVNEAMAKIFEPGAASVRQRLHTVSALHDAGVKTGVALMPLLPLLVEPDLEATMATVSQTGASFLVHKHLELKGEQRDHFLKFLDQRYPLLVSQYQRWYRSAIAPDDAYLTGLSKRINELCEEYQIKSQVQEG